MKKSRYLKKESFKVCEDSPEYLLKTRSFEELWMNLWISNIGWYCLFYREDELNSQAFQFVKQCEKEKNKNKKNNNSNNNNNQIIITTNNIFYQDETSKTEYIYMYTALRYNSPVQHYNVQRYINL